VRAAFTIERVYLYGHSQGGFFVVHFAGEHPTAVAGIVAHASGAWSFSKMGAPLKKVAIAFQHGTLDPVVPYAQSVGSRDAYAAAGFELLHLRRLDAYNHWPNAVRSTESLDWCEGMTTPSPARALELVRRILTQKKPDEYQWQTTVGYSGARDILRRLEKKGPAPFGEVPDDVAAATQAAIAQIELDATVNVSRLASLKSRKDLTLKSAPWLGHLVALREDFRGVDPVEKFVERIEFDAALSSQRKAADAITSAWYGSGSPKTIYSAIGKNLGDAFLVEGLPAELSERMEAWQDSAKSLGIDANTQKKYPVFESWRDGWKSGRESYREVWKQWKGL
jgi:pimeloyl-ACP methyl ester carboxylesterase